MSAATNGEGCSIVSNHAAADYYSVVENDMREVRQSLATAEKDHMNEKQALEAEITSLKAQLASSANTGVDLQSAEVQNYVQQQVQKIRDEMQVELAALRDEASIAQRQASDAMRDADKYQSDATAAEEKIQELKKELDTARSAKPSEEDNTEAIQAAMKEALQKIFEGMHEMFAEEDGELGCAQASQACFEKCGEIVIYSRFLA